MSPVGVPQPPDSIDCSFSIGIEAGNAIIVSGQLKKYNVPVDQRHVVTCWLSTDATGDVLSADPGTLVVGTNGTILVESTANLVFTVLTEPNGTFDINIGHVSTSGFYLNVALPSGRVQTAPIAQFA